MTADVHLKVLYLDERLGHILSGSRALPDRLVTLTSACDSDAWRLSLDNVYSIGRRSSRICYALGALGCRLTAGSQHAQSKRAVSGLAHGDETGHPANYADTGRIDHTATRAERSGRPSSSTLRSLRGLALSKHTDDAPTYLREVPQLHGKHDHRWVRSFCEFESASWEPSA